MAMDAYWLVGHRGTGCIAGFGEHRAEFDSTAQCGSQMDRPLRLGFGQGSRDHDMGVLTRSRLLDHYGELMDTLG